MRANPTDPFERLELAAWKLGFLDGATTSRQKGKMDLFAEDALTQLCGTNHVKASELISELDNCKKDMRAEILKRDPALAGAVDGILAGKTEERQPAGLIADGEDVNLATNKASLTHD